MMGTMKIPEEAVEAAARAEEDALYPGAWNELSGRGQDLRKDRLRPILEAAAPFIAAIVREEGRKAGRSPFKEQGPYGDTQ